MNASSLDIAGYGPLPILSVVAIFGASAIMSGLSGFGFSAIGALCLWLLPPHLGVPLLMSLSAANQLMSLSQIKADLKPIRAWWPDGPAPYLVGGLVGVPFGLAILHDLPTAALTALFGTLLLLYAVYSMFKPDGAHVAHEQGWLASSMVGMAGGVVGGFTAFPGAAVVIWGGLRKLSKQDSRAIVQPYILALQLVALAILAAQHPETFGAAYWTLFALAMPIVLPGTLLGVRLYRSLSEVDFRRVTFALLGISGVSLVAKASGMVLATLLR